MVSLPPAIMIEGNFIFANTIVMLAVGLTLTYMTTKVPNFAHGSLAMVGAYMLFTVVTIVFGKEVMKAAYQGTTAWGPIILGFVVAFLGGAFAGLMEYLLVLRPLSKLGSTSLGLMISTLGVDFFLIGLLNIYADILRSKHPITGTPRDWWLSSYINGSFAGASLRLWLSFIITFLSLLSLYLLLTRTRFGIAMRASIENPSLAEVLGVNVDLVNMVSWILAGGLAGLGGGLMAFAEKLNPITGSTEIVAVFAASIVGGLQSLLGAVIGGYIVGLSETLGAYLLGLSAYRRAIPMVFIIVTLLFAPEGIAGIDWRRVLSKIRGSRKP